jgi:DNA-binding protein HU-beta
LNKNDLVDRIAEDHELTARFARELVDSVFEAMANAARNGEEVSIFGFGFKVAERAARTGRNPASGESVKIAASKNLRFTPARSLKSSLNKRRARKTR